MPRTPYHHRLYTPLCDWLDCDYPVLQAGMGGVARAGLVAAVGNAGGYGFLGMVREPPARIQDEIDGVRRLSGRPFGVNIIPAATDRKRLRQQVDVCIDNRVDSVCLFWDVDAAVVERFRKADIRVFHQIGHAGDAVAAWRAGAQALIAQGCEAGGHVRSTQNLATLLPDIVDATPLPVIASGGIADGESMLAAMTLGAQGVHCGTLFLATDKSNAHPYHKDRIVQATAADTTLTTLFHINWPENAPVRVIHNSVTRRQDKEPDKVIGFEGERPIRIYSTDSPLAETRGDLEAMALYAGQGVSMIADVVPAGQRIHALMEHASTILEKQDDDRRSGTDAIETASPPCSLAEIDGRYAGYLDREELLDLLNRFLATNRACARTAAASIAQCQTAEQRKLLEMTHAGDTRCRRVLEKAIQRLGGNTDDRPSGDVYDRAMSVPELERRLSFLKQAYGALIRELDQALPAVRDEQLYNDLYSVNRASEKNVALLEAGSIADAGI